MDPHIKLETLHKLLTFCKDNDWRFGQALWNVMANRTGERALWEAPEANPLFFIFDTELEERINNLLNKNETVKSKV